MTHCYPQARCIVTATVALFYRDNSELVTFLGLRNPSSTAYPDHWCLPGGKLDAMCVDFPGETIQQCALREVLEETGMALSRDQLVLRDISSDPTTDPRGHFLNVVYTAFVTPQQHRAAKAGSDLVKGGWFNFKDSFGRRFAFDHADLLGKAQKYMRGWE